MITKWGVVCVILYLYISLTDSANRHFEELEGVASCTIPLVMQGAWFSRENGDNTYTEFDKTTMTRKGTCIKSISPSNDNITFIFRENSCYHCVRIYIRTVNVLEKIETGCVNAKLKDDPSFEEVCGNLQTKQELVTLFNQNPIPKHCRSSIEGVWHFGYQNRYRFTGECDHPEAQIRSCEEVGNQFLITNQKFNITYRKCEGMGGTENKVTEYSCLGDWMVGKNHFFAVSNTKESRIEERYRCFLKNRDDDLYIGSSITAECNILKTPESSPERLRLTPVKSESVIAGCHFPQNFSGEWINTANIDADVYINQTHIVERWHPDEGRYRENVYICKEQRGFRYMLTRLGIHGCQKEYVCFEFLPRHHNIIRFRKGAELIMDDFSTVCAWVRFPNLIEWKYDFFIARNPVPIRCPVAGKFKFIQKGEVEFETRIIGGITQNPIDSYYCRENISDFSVCDIDQKEINIDENHCIAVDKIGRPVDIYTDPDYKMKCVGYWKENLKSYLITYDELDSFSHFRCWVYQRADLDKLLMSQAIGSFCNLNQDVTSWNYTEGATVALKMDIYERERDQCPMHFDDGTNPWVQNEAYVKTFRFGSGPRPLASVTVLLCLLLSSSLLH